MSPVDLSRSLDFSPPRVNRPGHHGDATRPDPDRRMPGTDVGGSIGWSPKPTGERQTLMKRFRDVATLFFAAVMITVGLTIGAGTGIASRTTPAPDRKGKEVIVTIPAGSPKGTATAKLSDDAENSKDTPADECPTDDGDADTTGGDDGSKDDDESKDDTKEEDGATEDDDAAEDDNKASEDGGDTDTDADADERGDGNDDSSDGTDESDRNDGNKDDRDTDSNDNNGDDSGGCGGGDGKDGEGGEGDGEGGEGDGEGGESIDDCLDTDPVPPIVSVDPKRGDTNPGQVEPSGPATKAPTDRCVR
ncbi:hypothetical protein AB0H83_41340 [Dactylosporangium sp. NPDC050688]|uniref:hypothetical protein n=1 Tax=Dactylosporangium sp. NPDC050688 TaxID=3157217 RepID=UPI0033DB2012